MPRSKSASVVQEPQWKDYMLGIAKPEHTGPVKVRVLLRSWTKEFGRPRSIEATAQPDTGPFNTFAYFIPGPFTKECLTQQAQIACEALNHEAEWHTEQRVEEVARVVAGSILPSETQP